MQFYTNPYHSQVLGDSEPRNLWRVASITHITEIGKFDHGTITIKPDVDPIKLAHDLAQDVKCKVELRILNF